MRELPLDRVLALWREGFNAPQIARAINLETPGRVYQATSVTQAVYLARKSDPTLARRPAAYRGVAHGSA